MITYTALSLNEFVDSMLVSNLLGSDALAIVTLGTPVMLVMAALYSLLGSGGSTIYAIATGERDHETAGKSLTASSAAALAAGVLLLVLGNAFAGPLAGLLCKDQNLMAEFVTYIRVLMLSAPPVILILTFVSFLPSAGYPGFSTAVNVIANVSNIFLDYIYIRYFHMGVAGAAWATLTGYIIAAAVTVIYMAAGKIKLYYSKDVRGSFGLIGEVTKVGGPDAMSQVGMSIQFAVCNRLAAAAAGTNGVVAFSLCLQASSVISIFIGAIIGSAVPILAVLHGQRDYSGEAGILRASLVGQFVASVAVVAVLVVFAPQAAALYNITEAAQLELAVYALRVYSLMFLARDAVIVYFRYLKVIGLENYSTVLSALDSFAGIVPVAWIMVRLMGINGLWWAFLVTEVLLILLILICNSWYGKKSEGRLCGPLLIENDEEATPLLDVTISKDLADISGISMKLQQLCEENGLSRREALMAALAVEELAVYAANRKSQSSHMDILVRLSRGNVEIDFRSLGEAFDPLTDEDSDIQENVQLLRRISSSIENEYILGMNSTRIIMTGRGS